MYTEPQTEWKSQIRQVAHGYRSGSTKGLAHGLQKDAIQNGWGARRSENEWAFRFKVLRDSNGTIYLTMTDKGTHGLTGKIFDDPDAIPDNLPPEERLSRFENMNFSGGNYGPGLYGRGKLIFQATSKRGEIIYDSLLSSGEYRLGRRFQEGRHLRQFQKVLVNNDAKEMLAILTLNALQPLTEIGTRITIVDPIEEVIESINSGKFLEYIEETWWEILLKFNVPISVIYDGTEESAVCPGLLKKLGDKNFPNDKMHWKENDVITVKGNPYRIKRICMARADSPVPEEIRGLYIQRKGMKIGKVDLRDFPADLEEFFFGFIQLDKDYEELIEEAEDLEHYSFSATFSSYRELKKYAQAQFDEFKKKLGYDVATDQSADEKAQDALRIAEEKLNQVMADLGLSGIGRRPKQRDLTITVVDVTFPRASNRVELNEEIKDVTFRLKNKSKYERDLRILVETRKADGVLIETIDSAPIKIPPQSEKTLGPYIIKIKPNIYPNYEQVFCFCRAEDPTGAIKAQSSISIFIGIDPPQVIEPVVLRLTDIQFPRSESTRVNYGETIKNIRYLVKNQTANDLDVRFPVRTIDPKNEDTPIVPVLEKDFILKGFSEEEIEINNLSIDQARYSVVGEGEVQIRSQVISLKNQFEFKKGKRLAKHAIKFWLNRDEPGFGIFEDKQIFYGGADAPRAKVKQGSTADRWIFLLNVTHPNYEAVRDEEDIRNAYVFELMAREALYIALLTETYEPFTDPIKQGDLPYEVSRSYNATLDRVLASYY